MFDGGVEEWNSAVGSEGPGGSIEVFDDGLVGETEFGGNLLGEDAGVEATENVHLSFG